MYCSKCGTQLSKESLFCFQCGEKTENQLLSATTTESNQSLQQNSTSNIKKYLEYAKTLETNRFTMNQTINRLQNEINQLGYCKSFEKPMVERSDFHKPFWLVFIIGLLLIMIPSIINALKEGRLIVLAHSIVYGYILIVPFVAYISAKIYQLIKYSSNKQQYEKLIKNDKIRVEKEIKQIISLQQQQNNLKNEIHDTENTLTKLYDLNVVYPKYRELLPIVTMWEYMDSGRCSELTGPNGAYNLYETESRQNIIISNLNQAVSMLAHIKNNQYALYEAIQESNEIAERVCMQNEQLLASNMNIERNAELTAYNSKISAQNSNISAFVDTFNF